MAKAWGGLSPRCRRAPRLWAVRTLCDPHETQANGGPRLTWASAHTGWGERCRQVMRWPRRRSPRKARPPLLTCPWPKASHVAAWPLRARRCGSCMYAEGRANRHICAKLVIITGFKCETVIYLPWHEFSNEIILPQKGTEDSYVTFCCELWIRADKSEKGKFCCEINKTQDTFSEA